MGAHVEVRDLATAYQPGRTVLDGLSLDVTPGEVVALVGANGSGKTTLLRCVGGLTRPGAGRVLVDGVDVGAARGAQLRAVRRRTGFVFQRFGLAPGLSALSNVLHGALGRGGPRSWWAATAPAAERAAALTCLARVGLADRAGERVDRLSGGQRQRVAVARALMQRPALLLADEPVASLDPAAGVAVLRLLRDVAREDGLTTILALHQLDWAVEFADRVVGLRAGRVAVDRSASGLGAGALDDLYAAATA
jgi:phosphonate transport system ATP-binding protein